MGSFRHSSLRPLAVAMALALMLGFGLARGLHATEPQGDSGTAPNVPREAGSADNLRSQLDVFSQVLYLVENNYVEPPDNEKLIHGAIDGMLKTLDPHTVYLPEKRAERMDEDFRGEYSGIGIQFEIRDGAIVVISPLEGTPAFRLGITAGDRIIEVDRKPLAKDITNDDVFKLLRGPNGSTVEVTIARDDVAEPMHFSIERAKIPIESIPYSYMIRPGVGYVRIVRFSQTTGEELEKAMTKLKGEGMKSLLIDLRSNSGGLLSQAVDVLDQLVPNDKLLVYTRGRIPTSNADYRSTNRPKLLSGPLVVLIDHGSASASEIVSGAIQDLDRGLVAGTNSFGKGLVQNQLRLSDGSKLLLTVAHYYTPSGRLIQRDYSKFADRESYSEDAFKVDVPSDSVLATMPKFKTAGGRLVYGGGGIYPDVLVKDLDNLTRPQADMIQKRAFWEFATRYLHKHKDTQWTSSSFDSTSFKLSDADWAELRKSMEDRKVAVSDSVWKADRSFIKHQTRMELANLAMGPTERYKIFTEIDNQLQTALDLFPRAAKLIATNAGAAPKN
jgi:carboxyl-terminal processing protease